MYAAIQKIRNLPDGGLYVLADFWRTKAWFDSGNPYDARNDFMFSTLAATGRQPKTNRDGHYVLVGGGTLDPSRITGDEDPQPVVEMETVDIDIKAHIRRQLSAYWDRRTSRGDANRLDHSQPAVVTSLSDPRGLRKATVRAMEGTSFDLGKAITP